jgi:anti-anti-sigma factor
MSTESAPVFSYEIEEAGSAATGYITVIRCHGKVISQTGEQIKELVKPLISRGGRIVLDFTGVTGVDSSGLGVLVGLKISAVGAGYRTLELTNLSPRVQELLHLTKLTQLFS